MKRLSVLLVLLLVSTGCARSLRTVALGDINSVPEAVYDAYIFSADGGLKAVLLKGPGSSVDVVAYSSEIVVIRGTPREVLAFLGKNLHPSVEGVNLDGKTVGYLLISDRKLFEARSLRVDLFARGGKIYFAITKTGYY